MMRETLRILLAEDSEHDIRAFTRCWRRVEAPYALHVVRDGEECLDYLFRQHAYAEPARSPHPDVLVSDCELRKVDGWEVLREVRASRDLQVMPVVLMDTSLSEAQIQKAYRHGANSIFLKPSGREALTAFLRNFMAYWGHAQLPRTGEDARRVR